MSDQAKLVLEEEIKALKRIGNFHKEVIQKEIYWPPGFGLKFLFLVPVSKGSKRVIVFENYHEAVNSLEYEEHSILYVSYKDSLDHSFKDFLKIGISTKFNRQGNNWRVYLYNGACCYGDHQKLKNVPVARLEVFERDGNQFE